MFYFKLKVKFRAMNFIIAFYILIQQFGAQCNISFHKPKSWNNLSQEFSFFSESKLEIQQFKINVRLYSFVLPVPPNDSKTRINYELDTIAIFIWQYGQ